MILTRSNLLPLVVVGLSSVVAGSMSARAAGESGIENRVDKTPLDDMVPPIPGVLRDILIEDKVGDKVPLDVTLTDENGESVVFGDYLLGGKPALLILGYYQCPTLCSAIMNGALDALDDVSLDAGKDFEVLIVSIDPKETHKVASEKRATYLKAYDREGADQSWHFMTGPESEVRKIADAVGFAYRWDEKGQQYAHAGGIFFLAPDGTLTRTLWGMRYSSRDVKFALMDASEGKVGSVLDQVWLSCFSYTPDSQRYAVYIWGAMRLAGFVTLFFIVGGLLYLWRRYERNKSRRRRQQAAWRS